MPASLNGSTLPEVDQTTAEVLIAETGADMTRPTTSTTTAGRWWGV